MTNSAALAVNSDEMESEMTETATETEAVAFPKNPKKRTRTKKAKTAKPAKPAKAAKAPAKPRAKKATGPLPALGDLRLAGEGIHTSKKNRYVNLEFSDGLIIRLYPVGYPKNEVQRVTDLVVAWLQKRLG